MCVAGKSSTKRKILELGESLLQRLGYNGFSYHHIAQELGIKNAAIHYHFPTKEALGIEIVQRTRTRFTKWVNHPENRVKPVRQQFDWFINSYSYNLKSQHRVCLIGSLATDYYTLPPSMQSVINELTDEIQKWMARLLDHGRQSGVVDFQGSSQDKAVCILSSLTGSLQLARLLGDDFFYRNIKQIYLDLNFTY